MNILHLSDIHFGRNYPYYGIKDNFSKHDKILDELINIISNLDDMLKPEHILFTGDIVWHGKSKEYKEAEIWFKKLLKACNLTGKDISFCVGNHNSEFPAFPDRKEFDIYASMLPAKEIGGDFYDYYLIDSDHLVLIIADVSDKGVPSALFMSMSRTILKLNAETYHSPKEIMEYSNNLLCDESKDRMFVTAWLGIYEISTGTLTCVNAGHEYPIIKRNNGDYEIFKDKHSFVLGGLRDVPFKEYTLKLNVGDELLLYTDGVAEATSEDDELFGLDRTVSTLNEYKNCNQKELHKKIEQTLLEFTGNNNQFDDITMLSFKVSHI